MILNLTLIIMHGVLGLDLTEICVLAEGYSCRDIKTVCVSVLFEAPVHGYPGFDALLRVFYSF